LNIQTEKDLIRAIENKKIVDISIDKNGQYCAVFSKDVVFADTFVKNRLLDKRESIENVIITTEPSYQRSVKNEK
jgi:hypothetical protein